MSHQVDTWGHRVQCSEAPREKPLAWEQVWCAREIQGGTVVSGGSDVGMQEFPKDCNKEVDIPGLALPTLTRKRSFGIDSMLAP